MMAGLPPCVTKPAKPCPERFRASASEWIDETNFGDLPEDLSPPAGIRLRWSWPLRSGGGGAGTGEPALPDRFTVRRHGPIPPERLVEIRPTVGHMPRMFALPPLWKDLVAEHDRSLVVDSEDGCTGAQAIHLVMQPHAPRVSIALIDVAGEVRLTGELGGGDIFYYELGDIRRVSFSAPPFLALAKGLSLTAADAQAADLGFDAIATIDARVWLTASFDQVAERMASETLASFVTISEPEWRELQGHGVEVIDAIEAGMAPPPHARNFLALATALRWEIASLVGQGFLDGAHVAAPIFDQIDAAAMLTPAESGVYAYQITAEFDGEEHGLRSDIALTFARPMPALSGADVFTVAAPKTRGELVNHIDQTETGVPVPTALPDELTFCTSGWQIVARAPYVERVFTSPHAADSQIFPQVIEEAGEFSADGARRPPAFRGMERLELRDHVFQVAFYDSDIWLTLAAGDHWDRRVGQAPTPPVQPEIDYAGRCISLVGGACNPVGRTVTLSLDLDGHPGWTADPLATYARARIELLLKRPDVEPLAADVTLFAASPARGGAWSAEIETDLAIDELAPFVGGTLETEGMHARIFGFAPLRRRRFRCEFEAIPVCAGATLYAADPNGIAARIVEAEGSERVWKPAGAIPLLLDGTPGASTGTIDLPDLETSMLLYCTTRLGFDFEGKEYSGPLTARVAIPYVHPAPPPPKFCVGIRTLGVDYYGRTVIRAEASDCEGFDPALAVSLAAAAGVVEPAEFAGAASDGLFGAQAPLGHRVVFDAFELLGHQPEGTVNTLGVRHVRTSDGRDSDPELQWFGNWRTN